jgi:large subunit ribosomal protein L10
MKYMRGGDFRVKRSQKEQSVEELRERLKNHSIAILTKYQGINVAKVTELRRKLRDNGVEFKVYKNTLARIVLDELGLDQAAKYMEGPTAWAFSNDPVAPAKVLKDFAKEVNFVAMQGGILDGKVLGPEGLNALADLPSRDQLIAQVVGTIAAPLRSTVGVLNALPRNLANAIDQIRKQKEESGAAA